MKKIKLTLFLILISMYQIALSDSGLVKFIGWIAFGILFISLIAQMEKRYGVN